MKPEFIFVSDDVEDKLASEVNALVKRFESPNARTPSFGLPVLHELVSKTCEYAKSKGIVDGNRPFPLSVDPWADRLILCGMTERFPNAYAPDYRSPSAKVNQPYQNIVAGSKLPTTNQLKTRIEVFAERSKQLDGIYVNSSKERTAEIQRTLHEWLPYDDALFLIASKGPIYPGHGFFDFESIDALRDFSLVTPLLRKELAVAIGFDGALVRSTCELCYLLHSILICDISGSKKVDYLTEAGLNVIQMNLLKEGVHIENKRLKASERRPVWSALTTLALEYLVEERLVDNTNRHPRFGKPLNKLSAYGVNLALMVIKPLLEDWYSDDPHSLVAFLQDRERFRHMLNQGYPKLLRGAKAHLFENPSKFE